MTKEFDVPSFAKALEGCFFKSHACGQKSSICPPSPRLRRVVSLSPTRVAKKFDVPSFAKALEGCFFKSHA
ncbi:MAG: hypothetical protein EBS69_10215, partial [Verrucomicrobia bacterium]|nr:hypothetical protein [Verrucomicrobiota bacterium]